MNAVNPPTDPVARLEYFLDWVRRERRLSAVLAAVALLLVVGWGIVASEQPGPWNSQEIANLRHIPLPPPGVRPATPTEQGPGPDEIVRLEEFSRTLLEPQGSGGTP